MRIFDRTFLIVFGLAIGASLAFAGIKHREQLILHANCVGTTLAAQPNACVIYTHKGECVSWPERKNGNCFIEDRPQ